MTEHSADRDVERLGEDLEREADRLERHSEEIGEHIDEARDEWDRRRTPNWTLREICGHLTGVLWYAEQVGRLPR